MSNWYTQQENNVNEQAYTPVEGSQQPVGYERPEYNTQNRYEPASQQNTQQRMNYQAQMGELPSQQPNQQANASQQEPRKPVRTITVGGEDIPFYPAPTGHATASMTRLGQLARKQEREQEDPGVPASATVDAIANARYISMPAGGLSAAVELLWPNDVDNQEVNDKHLQDLLNLNRGIVNNENTHTVGTMIRVPGDV